MNGSFYNRGRKASMGGFSMIEILIAILVLAFGLLGFALLQTMNLRYAQSANQRTQATNLAYELLDMIRANRVLVNDYTQLTPASFAAAPSVNCPMLSNVASTPVDNMDRWRCQVKSALGDSAQAALTLPTPGEVNIRIRWGDERWNVSNPNTTFDVRTRL